MAKRYVESKTIEHSGALPITINADGNALLDYRVYGANGGVGDRTENLWNVSFEQGVYRSADGEKLDSTNYVRSAAKVAVDANTEYTFSFATTNPSRVGRLISFIFWNSSNEVISSVLELNSKNATFTTPNGTVAMTVSISLDTQFVTVTPADIAYAMLVEGSTAPVEYVPYGYKLPMSVSDGTTSTTIPIYIGDTPLGEDEYVSYSKGKIYRRTENDFPFAEKGTFAFGNDGSIVSDGEGKFAVSISSAIQGGTKSAKIPINRPYTIPQSIDTGGEFAFYLGNNDVLERLRLCFYNANNVLIEEWLCSSKWRISTAYSQMSGKTVAYVGVYTNSTILSGNIELAPMFSKNDNLSTYIPYLQPQDPPVPLPALPTCDGTTIVDYDGTPKPSQMYVKYTSQSGWEPCGEHVRRNGVWVDDLESIRHNGAWEQQTAPALSQQNLSPQMSLDLQPIALETDVTDNNGGEDI